MALLKILAVLAICLFVVVKLTERVGKERSMSQMQSLSKWILPLVGISLVLQLIYSMVG
ncbi:hypothetical protein K0504_15960 [Neiella marina]|uniref:Uncharacterized protein n=1 Tax=Neiella holothuriorum TaxID=2870530 RepID=A0ABS7EJN4_9GAMM|nr:hypothetical protein [Neiella holothuriorum]MBW8192535.1 hypothetical protein [Neiella holothuriorum]